MSNCHSKYLYFINRENSSKSNKIRSLINKKIRTTTRRKTNMDTLNSVPVLTQRPNITLSSLKSQLIYPQNILVNNTKMYNKTYNAKTYTYFIRKITYIKRNLLLRQKKLNNLRDRIRRKIHQIQMR